MKIAKSFKIWFLLIAFALSLALAFSFVGFNGVSADSVSVSEYFGGTAKIEVKDSKLSVTAKNDDTLSVTNKLAIDDFETSFTVADSVNTVKLTLKAPSYFGAGVAADENASVNTQAENVISLDFANSEFSLNGVKKALSGRTVKLGLSVSNDGKLTVSINGESVTASDDMHRIGGTDKTAASFAFKFETSAESVVSFEYFDQAASVASGEYKQTFAEEKLKSDGKALPRVAIKSDFDVSANNVKLLNGKVYSFSFNSYSLLGWSGSFKIKAAEGISEDKLWIKATGDEARFIADESAVTENVSFNVVSSGDKVVESYVANVFNKNSDTTAPVYTASTEALNAYKAAVKNAVMTTYTLKKPDGTSETVSGHVKLGDKITIPSLKGLVSDDFSDYGNLKHTVYYRTPTSSTGSTDGWTITLTDAGRYQFFVVFTDEAGNAMKKADFYETDDDGNYKPYDGPLDDYPYGKFVFTFDIEDDAPIYVYAASSQKAGYLNTPYTFSAFSVEASGYKPVYKLMYCATKDGEYKEIPAKSTLPSDKKNYSGEDFTYDEVSGFAYDGKLSFTPINKGYYKVVCTVSSTKLIRSETAETQVVEVSKKPTVVKPASHWLENNVWSVVFLSIGTLCLIGIIVLLFIKPKEETDVDTDVK